MSKEKRLSHLQHQLDKAERMLWLLKNIPATARGERYDLQLQAAKIAVGDALNQLMLEKAIGVE